MYKKNSVSLFILSNENVFMVLLFVNDNSDEHIDTAALIYRYSQATYLVKHFN